MSNKRKSNQLSSNDPMFYRTVIKLIYWVSPSLAEKLVSHLFIKPPVPTTIKDSMKFFKSESITQTRLRGYDLRMSKSGKGPVVLLVHEWGQNGRDFENLVSVLLDENYSVILPDLPCHGASSGKTIDFNEMSNVLEDLIISNSAKNQIDHMVTHGLTSVPFFLALDRLKYDSRKLHIGLKKIVTLGAPTSLDSYMNNFCKNLQLNSELVDRLKKELSKMSKTHKTDQLSTIELGLFDKQDFQLLVVHDKEDPVVPYTDALELNKAYKASRLSSTSGLGHYDIVKDKNVIREVIDFLDAAEPIN